MKFHLETFETERLILRKILPTDAPDLFEMDSDPEVHRYLEKKPVQHLSQITTAIQLIQKQYLEHGIGRWAVIEKKSQELIGWSGLKLYTTPVKQHINFYEMGYRFKQKHWGKGFATESVRAWLDCGFKQLQLQEIFAMTDIEHQASKKVLLKTGFKYLESFDYAGSPIDWFKITNTDR